ncbi:3-isopropylmalate dehydratase large subunit [Paraburkholderia silvatlantica]|uniref:3-isopropylmalate dehydratase large subunit n=1 Tax=Paraburkholderia silvatlantica TaxID=321895 RepID=UPI00105B995A|nr:3-isopropylmalate dehydratase large subunit [Paraburkholderia silvatlantica]TDQ73563.1 3-isopropylmalate dehydratase large subunit [Paraburkholderia silvatlantica]
MSKTLYDKIFDSHAVRTDADGTTLLYIDRHLLNEVTSPQAFESLRHERRPVWRPRANLAVADHNVPTTARDLGIVDSISRIQVDALRENCQRNDIAHYGMEDVRQGIVHVVAPELGATLPGMTIVCGDSHTSTHGALGALAFGIGTSEIGHVLATQTLVTRRSRTMRVTLNGVLPVGCSAKDLALAVIGLLGTAGATGYAIEFAGPVVRALSMEGRMTLCNMSIEAGARAGLIAVDDTTLDYCRTRERAPRGEAWDRAARVWRDLRSDDDARFDTEHSLDVSALAPQVTWGTSPEMVTAIHGRVPDPTDMEDAGRRASYKRALEYMDLQALTPIEAIAIDKVFIGSCTNGRLEDLRAAADVLRTAGGRIAPNVRLALAVPGSQQVKREAQALGLHEVFIDAGFEWREPGCSMCLAMNADRLEPGERVASTSNRNFEGRQGAGGRSHLVSPAMAAAAALAGRFVDVRKIVKVTGGQ